MRFCRGYFQQEVPTIGASYYTKSFALSTNKKVKFEVSVNNISLIFLLIIVKIWDTAGLERYRALAPMYYRNSDAAILVYDITNLESFNALKHWHTELLNKVPNCLIIIIGNKIDLMESRQVDPSIVEEYAKQYNIPFYETSSKTGQNVNEVFMDLGKMLMEKHSQSNT